MRCVGGTGSVQRGTGDKGLGKDDGSYAPREPPFYLSGDAAESFFSFLMGEGEEAGRLSAESSHPPRERRPPHTARRVLGVTTFLSFGSTCACADAERGNTFGRGEIPHVPSGSGPVFPSTSPRTSPAPNRQP
jgi:hypothetical protein